MNIILQDGTVVMDVTPIKTKEDITEGCKLYFGLVDDWGATRREVFKEIKNPLKYKEEEFRWDNGRDRFGRTFIEHHRFVVKGI